MVHTYKRSEKVQLAKNFRLDEFKCKCGKCDPILLDDKLVEILQGIRDHFGKSVNVNSGYRCAAHNASPRVGGHPSSHHLKGMAADIRVEGITPREVARYAESVGVKRIGLYDTFCHIGSGTTKKFWVNKNTNPVDTFGAVVLTLPVLHRGARSDTVKAVQKLVGAQPDGSFGPATQAAVQAFQKQRGLEPEGSVGAATWAALLGVGA